MCLDTTECHCGGCGEAKLPSVENNWGAEQECVSHCVFFSLYELGIGRSGMIGRASHSGIWPSPDFWNLILWPKKKCLWWEWEWQQNRSGRPRPQWGHWGSTPLQRNREPCGLPWSASSCLPECVTTMTGRETKLGIMNDLVCSQSFKNVVLLWAMITWKLLTNGFWKKKKFFLKTSLDEMSFEIWTKIRGKTLVNCP